MGVLSRMTTIFKAKISKLLDQAEDPRETLDYSYQKQVEHLQKVKRGIAEVITAKKRLELQSVSLKQEMAKLEDKAREALKAGREDLARLALERKQSIQSQLEGLESQVKDLEKEQEKLTATESRLRAKVEAFRTQKEVIKAQYSAAEAQVKIGEAVTGLSEEMADVGMAIERAKDKTEKVKARAAAIDEMISTGVLEDKLTTGDDIDIELEKIKSSKNVEEDLARLKREVRGQ